MGIRVEGKTVGYDPTSKELINSNPADNPIVQDMAGLSVLSIFRRVKATRPSPNDGNPLIYALKRQQGYTIAIREVKAFLPDFYGVLSKAAPLISASYLLPIPSSSKVVAQFTARIMRELGCESAPFSLEKKTHRKICADLDARFAAQTIAKKDLRAMKSLRHDLAKSLSTTFSMKLVDHSLRGYFEPFLLRNPGQVPVGESILLVDDLLSSGSSLRCAKGLLNAQGITDVKCVCLLSSTGPYKRAP